MTNALRPLQVGADKARMIKSTGPISGRTDGVGTVVDAGGDAALTDGLMAFANGDPVMPLEPSMWCREFIDFNGLFTMADVGDTFVNHDSPWALEAANSTSATAARAADHRSGAMDLTTSNTSEIAEHHFGFGDELNIDSDLGAIMRCRLQFVTEPTSADSLCWGFGNNRNDLMDSVTNRAWFNVTGANSDLLISADDATTADDDNDTAINMVAGTYMEFMISMNPIHDASAVDVRFFQRSTLGGQWNRLLTETTFSFLANTLMQPYLQVEKTTGTSTPDLRIDYIDVIWLRE